jgi:DNA invertase Pin-like site-specific DNA recombinase
VSTLTRARTAADTIRAALYHRVSTADQSIARQHAENLAACERYGWEPAEYDDLGLSASRFAGRRGGANRAHYGRLLADLSAGQLGVIVLWEASRGNRQLTGWSLLLDACRRHGVLIHITSEGYTYDLSRARDWKALAEAGVASAMESETLSLRVRSGKDAGMKAGRPQGGLAYGIRRVRDPLKAKHAWLRDEADPVTGPVAARIIRAVAAGEGFRAIADQLTAEHIPAARGGRWHAATVHKIAGNPAYVAAGVVDEETSLRARARLADPGRKGERASRQVYRYTGVLRCSVCAQPVRGARRAGTDRYLCPSGHISITAAEVDDWVDMLAVARLAEPDLIGLFDQADPEAASAARAEAAGHRTRIAEAGASYAAGRIELDTLEAITAACRPAAEAAERRARDAEMPTPLRGLPDPSKAVAGRRWASLTVPARKAALRILAPDAVIRPGRRGANPAPVSERVILWPSQCRAP